MPGTTAIRGTSFSLETPNTQIVFARRGDVWTFAHIGEKGGTPGEYATLAAMRPVNDDQGSVSMETYPAFGSDRCRDNGAKSVGHKFGALQVRHCDGDESVQWKCVRASLVGGSHAVFELADKKHSGFRAIQHFSASPDCDVFETWVEIVNGEEAPVALSRMDTFCLDTIGIDEQFHVMSLCGLWANEANVSECRLERGQKIVLGARSGIHDAWECNPAFMLSMGNRATEETGRVLAGALCWSGTWEISFQHVCTHEIRVNAGVANISGPYVLDAGKSIALPKFVFTFSDRGKGAATRALHRWARRHLMPHPGEREVLLNAWEGAYFTFDEKVLTGMMDGTKALGGELFVVDDGWFGRGKYARNNERVGLGDWFVNREKLPHGLAWLASQARRRGLKFGLWFEPEMASMQSELVEAHPDWVLQEAGRPIRCGRGFSQVVLDMTNPAVRDGVFSIIDATIREIDGLDYIKWDANTEILNAGSPFLGPGKQANLWFDYTQGVYELFARLRAAHPGIVFQACASGGGHAEFGFLGHADEFWGSDNSCAQQRVLIQWGESQFYPAAAMACHVTAVPNHQTGRDASLKYRFDVAMSGRLGIELQPGNMKPEEVDFAKRCVANYKRLRPVIQNGDLWRLASPYETDHSALLFVSGDKRRAVVMVYGLNRRYNDGRPAPLRLVGLDPAKRYRIEEINVVEPGRGLHTDLDGKMISGAALASGGIAFDLGPGDDSLVLELTAGAAAHRAAART